MERLRIASRKSPLALRQAEIVSAALRRSHPRLRVEIVGMTTEGDRLAAAPGPLPEGKSLFTKELEKSLLEGRADVAAHSMKDVAAEMPEDLSICAVLERADPRDALLSDAFPDLAALPARARVGTSSLRRRSQLLALRPDLQVVELRGNVGTRIARMEQGSCDALVLAAAGLERLGLKARIREYLAPGVLIPAIGQGAIGIQARRGHGRAIGLLAALDHEPSRLRVVAERALSLELQGSCRLPVAAHAEWRRGQLRVRGMVGRPDGGKLVIAAGAGPAREAAMVGCRLARQLLLAGADSILRELGVAI